MCFVFILAEQERLLHLSLTLRPDTLLLCLNGRIKFAITKHGMFFSCLFVQPFACRFEFHCHVIDWLSLSITEINTITVFDEFKYKRVILSTLKEEIFAGRKLCGFCSFWQNVLSLKNFHNQWNFVAVLYSFFNIIEKINQTAND